jgi:hypothetical protein
MFPAPKTYRIFMSVFGVVMIAWGIAYGYATYNYDQCARRGTENIQSLQVQIDALESAKASGQKK